MKNVLSRIEFLARRRVLAHPGVSVSLTAKVKYANFRLCPRSSLRVGDGSIVECQIVSEREGAQITIGKDSFIGSSLVSCAANIDIGDDVLISWGCNLIDHNSHPIAWSKRKDDVRNWYGGTKDWSNVDIKPIRIGNKSWLGFNVSILKGVEIGEGAIVGAGSLVTRNVPPWTIVGGNPARTIRELSLEER